ncbi:pectate lyase [Salibacterium lacus]|uniref:Pectate lyase n=1 Tax=Salibacterium lacus TaxID=1898109 RepID=A0ABW5T5I8_9BACI
MKKPACYTAAVTAALLIAPHAAASENQPADKNVYEAEAAEGEGIVTDTEHKGYTGDGFVDFDPNEPGGYVEWNIDVPSEGDYRLGFRYAHGGSENRHAAVQVDGEERVGKLDFEPTGQFDDYNYAEAAVSLTEGSHTIRLTAAAAQGGANIDHLLVRPAVDKVKEAETAVHDGVIIDNKHTGFTGEGFTDFNPNVPGGYVEWTVDVPSAGEYTLDVKYAHAGGSDRPAEISVNGVAEAELRFPPTPAWNAWKTESMQVNLDKGTQTIRLTAVGAEGGGNIDHLRIHNTIDTGDGREEVDTENVPLEQLAGGVIVKKMEDIGMKADIEEKQDDPVTVLEFAALINKAFGFDQRDMPHTGNGGQTGKAWGAYVKETARAHHYIPDHLDEQLQWNKPITKRETALITADLLDAVPDNEEGPGMMGRIAGEGWMNEGSASQPAIPSDMTFAEAETFARELTNHSDKNTGSVQVAKADMLTPHLIAVTLNGTIPDVQVNDIGVSIPAGEWESLTPLLNQELRISEAAATTDTFGNTVLVMKSMDELQDGAAFFPEETEPSFSGNLDDAVEKADNMLTWQMEHGGWSKAIDYSAPWDGEEPRSEWEEDGKGLGMIDNNATVKEIRFLSEVYQATGEEKYKEAVQRGLDFLMDLQYDTGGFAQVYPRRGNYSDAVTFNDNAMVRVLDLMDDMVKQEYPFQGNLMSEEDRTFLQDSLDLAVEYILNAQIEVDGTLTAWGAQHDPFTYEPVQARSYEHPSISGSESVPVIRFLMSRDNQTEKIQQAVEGALRWFEEARVEDMRYVSGGNENNEYFVEEPGATLWYRFYEIGTNKPIFSGRDGVIQHDIQEIEKERRDGYQWAGNYAESLLDTAGQTGYFEGNVYAQVQETNSVDQWDRTLQEGDVEKINDYSKKVEERNSSLTVSKDGSGDYETVQAAIDAVPGDNTSPVTIEIKNGTYEEVVEVPAGKPFITLKGESRDKTIITYDNHAGKANGVGGTIGTSASASVFIKADDFQAADLTFENSFPAEDGVEGRQAVAVNARGERLIFDNVAFLGHQDTLLANSGTHYYHDSYIEGDVDFIFGGARAVFEDTTVHSLDRGSDSNNGYITAASTVTEHPYGFLFLNSELTSDAPAETVYLGRPWQPGGNPEAVASVVFKNSTLGAHIKQEGWTEMGGFPPEEARFYEYNNDGPGAVVNEQRPQLREDEAADYTAEQVLGGWKPEL